MLESNGSSDSLEVPATNEKSHKSTKGTFLLQLILDMVTEHNHIKKKPVEINCRYSRLVLLDQYKMYLIKNLIA